jgi:hypothetical protein
MVSLVAPEQKQIQPELIAVLVVIVPVIPIAIVWVNINAEQP